MARRTSRYGNVYFRAVASREARSWSACGGHGPVLYGVTKYESGRHVRFEFKRPAGFHGYHEFIIEPEGSGATTRSWHVLQARMTGPALILWPLFFRPLHDALIEDAFDKAEREVLGAVRSKASWARVVRSLVTPRSG